jgi:hypothetical protein
MKLPPPPLPNTLYDDIESLRQRAHEYLDAEAAKDAAGCMPVQSCKQMLLAKGAGDVFLATQMRLDADRFNAAWEARKLASLRDTSYPVEPT